jgi:glycosyltransferase involved in cell wall biosynthesis
VSTVHVVLPDGVDDPARPSGGNHYDRQVCAGLARQGWTVREVVVPGGWPRPSRADLARLAEAVGAVPDGALLLVDGLVASGAGAVLTEESRRLRLVVLVHMPFGDVEVPGTDERAVLASARTVVTTSSWTRHLLITRCALDPDRVLVAHPGAEPGEPVPGGTGGGRLLCVAAVAPHKGQDVLVDALARLTDRSWHLTLVGPLDRDPAFVARLHDRAAAGGIGDRIAFRGPLARADLGRQYAAADLLVAPSRLEAYGMTVTEALARGLPVIVAATGGLPEAVGTTPVGPPGLLVPPDDAPALRGALAAWLHDADLRHRLRRAALARRAELPGWDETARRLAAALAAAAEPAPATARIDR